MKVRELVSMGACMMALVGCGSSGKTAGENPALLQRVDEICNSEKSGGEAWDKRIKALFVEVADNNQSGDLDSLAELQTIPCAVWRRMDEGVEADEDSGFMTIYGFHPRLIWVGSAVGVNEALRDVATAQLSGCGLSAGMD